MVEYLSSNLLLFLNQHGPLKTSTPCYTLVQSLNQRFDEEKRGCQEEFQTHTKTGWLHLFQNLTQSSLRRANPLFFNNFWSQAPNPKTSWELLKFCPLLSRDLVHLILYLLIKLISTLLVLLQFSCSYYIPKTSFGSENIYFTNILADFILSSVLKSRSNDNEVDLSVIFPVLLHTYNFSLQISSFTSHSPSAEQGPVRYKVSDFRPTPFSPTFQNQWKDFYNQKSDLPSRFNHSLFLCPFSIILYNACYLVLEFLTHLHMRKPIFNCF